MRKHYADVAQCKPHFSLHLFGFTPPDDVYLYCNLLFPDMKRLTLLLALFCSVLISIVSCDKNGSDDPSPDDGPTGIPEEFGDFELAEGAVFMTEDMTSMFSSVEDGKILIPASVSQSSVPAEGTIIIAPITEKTPSGLLVRVVSVQETASGYVLTTEPVSLFDAFEELKVDTAIDISPYLEAIKDMDGNTTDFESITDDIWSQFIGEDSEDTKSKATVTMPAATIGVSVEAAGFSGQLYTSFELTATVDISRVRQVNSFEFKVNRKTGVSGGWSVEHEGEWEKKYLEKEYSFAPIHIPGTPLVLTPKLYAELAGSYEGKTEFQADVNYLFEDQTYTISCTKGNSPTFSSENNPVVNEKSFLFGHLTFDGTFSLSATAGGKICLYNENVLAVGGELGAEAVFSASAGVNMDDAGLLIQNPEVSFDINFEASLYSESLIFKLLPDNDDGRISKDFEFPLVGLTLHALPAYSDLELGSMTASGKFEKYSMIVCSEMGFALFEEDGNAALEHQPISGGAASKVQTKAVVELPKVGGSITFITSPDPDKEYIIKPYVKAWGKYYYGSGGDDRWVDLGLPSGILWAKYNVGATSPEEYGGYYAWGETEEKSSYTWENYKYGVKIWSEAEDRWIWHVKGLPYDIRKTQFDVAHLKWGEGARMPTVADIEELINNCKWEKQTYNNTQGYIITGPNNNLIFIPMEGYFFSGVPSDTYGFYWSSTYSSNDFAYGMYLDWEHGFRAWDWNCVVGAAIRPVKDKESIED